MISFSNTELPSVDDWYSTARITATHFFQRSNYIAIHSGQNSRLPLYVPAFVDFLYFPFPVTQLHYIAYLFYSLTLQGNSFSQSLSLGIRMSKLSKAEDVSGIETDTLSQPQNIVNTRSIVVKPAVLLQRNECLQS